MSIRAKLIGGCDALLLAVIGAFQIGMLMAIASVAPSRGALAQHEPIAVDTAHVEVVVVEASKNSRG